MKKSTNRNMVNDYWQFTKELRGQLNAVHVLEREFFELEDLCDWAIKNEATYLDDGKRVSVVKCLDARQKEVYVRLCKVVDGLGRIMDAGKVCFDVNEDE